MTPRRTPRTALAAKIIRLEAKREKVRVVRWGFEGRASQHQANRDRRLHNFCLAEQKTHDTAGTPEYAKALDRYNSLGKNCNKEKVARDKASARAEELRQEEEALTRQIQTLKEDGPVPLTHFVDWNI